MDKKQIRSFFRNACYKRDKYKCAICGSGPYKENTQDYLDAHHITSRKDFPNGGYNIKNGITLCKTGSNCHLKAELWLQNGTGEPGLDPDSLYKLINSSLEEAQKEDASM